MAANHFTASGIVTSYHVPIAFPALVYGGASSTPNTPTGPHGSAKAVRPDAFIRPGAWWPSGILLHALLRVVLRLEDVD